MTVDPDSFTEYQKLWEHVCWTFPLYSYDAPSNSIDLGPYTAESDEHDYSPGPMHYWYKELKSGARVVLQRPRSMHDHYRFINVYADRLDIDLIIDELDLPLKIDWRTDSSKELWYEVSKHFEQTYCYSLFRLDDNDNQFLMESCLCEEGANCLAFRYTQKGHKQSYYVRKVT